MKVIYDIDNEYASIPKAVTVGFFDGVHIGHRFLINQLRAIAQKRDVASGIVTFSEHPRKVLPSEYCPQLIMSQSEKICELEKMDIDYCYFLHFTMTFASLSAKEFIQKILKQKIGASILLVGYDHRFGKNREEGFDKYVEYGKEVGMDVIQLPPYSGKDVLVSSSVIRREILAGNMEQAALMLSRPFCLEGTVVEGFKIGRELGFPTANLLLSDNDKILPPDGVYVVRLHIDGRTSVYGGMLYIGERPTFNNGKKRSIEVNIFDFTGDIYGKRLSVFFLKKIRDDIRFGDKESLKQQIEKDKTESMAILSCYKI